MDRRAFLRGAGALGGAAVLGARLPGALAADQQPLASILDDAPGDCPIDTVVVVMMENRSFDHYLSWLATDETYMEAGRSRWGGDFSVDGVALQHYTRADGSAVDTFPLGSARSEYNRWRGCGHPDPAHGWESGRAQRDHGFVAEGSGNDDYALGFYEEAALPCYGPLARNFTTFDRYFCSAMTGTYPNRYYLHAAQGDGTRDGSLPVISGHLGLEFDTIWDRLMAAGVPCRYFGTDLPVTGFWGYRLLPITTSVAEFLVEAAAGTLPNVVFVDPGFMSGMRTDDHPNGDMRLGQAFVSAIAGALMRGPQWERTALVVTYDEWGGFFDHITPPVLPDDRASADDSENWGQTGFRLPVFLASPFARPGYVDHRVYDHTSVLRFIEWRFLGAPAEGPAGDGWWLTQRDHHANNIGASLSPARQTDYELPADNTRVAVSLPCNAQYFQDVPGLQDVEDDGLVPAMDQLGLSLDPISGTGVSIPPRPPSPDHSLADAAEAFAARGFRVESAIGLAELLGL